MSLLQSAWVCNFKKIARLSKVLTPQEFDRATELAKGSTWYYRDVAETAMSGKLMVFQSEKRVTTPTVNVGRFTTESVPDNTATILTPNQLFWDNNAFWSLTVNPKRITFRTAGLYALGMWVRWDTSGNSYRFHALRKNGSTNIVENTWLPTTAGPTSVPLEGIDYFHAGDYVEVLVQHNRGSPLGCLLAHLWAVAVTPEALLP